MSCDSTCISIGIARLGQIIGYVISGAQPGMSPVFIELLTNVYNTIRCKLPTNIQQSIMDQISKLQLEISTINKRIYELYTIVIFSVLFLLILFLYITIFFQPSRWITFIFAILSILVIITGFLIIYFGITNINNNANTNIKTILTDINSILTNVQLAIEEGICCLGGCSSCTTC